MPSGQGMLKSPLIPPVKLRRSSTMRVTICAKNNVTIAKYMPFRRTNAKPKQQATTNAAAAAITKPIHGDKP